MSIIMVEILLIISSAVLSMMTVCQVVFRTGTGDEDSAAEAASPNGSMLLLPVQSSPFGTVDDVLQDLIRLITEAAE